MNMKKVLTVVLAVMLAISAMAITAFADEYVINLKASADKTGKPALSVVEFSIPVYPDFGYAEVGDYLDITLPSREVNGVEEFNYYVVANGVNYPLGTNDPAEVADYKYVQNDAGDWVEVPNNYKKTYTVKFGYQAHGWNDEDTVIPQSVLVGDNNTLKLVGTFVIHYDAYGNEITSDTVSAMSFKNAQSTAELNNGRTLTFVNDIDWGSNENTPAYVPAHTVLKANDAVPHAVANGNPINTSYSWESWNPVDGADIMGSDYTQYVDGLVGKWDATLANKAAILGADTAKVVLKLDRAIVGNYYFGLVATYADGSKYELGPNMNDYWLNKIDTAPYAAYVEIEAPTDTITFEIPVEVLYSARYGVFNHSLEVVCIDAAHKNMIDTIDTIADQTEAAGTLGDYSWTVKSWDTDVVDKYFFCGQEINFYYNQWDNVLAQDPYSPAGTYTYAGVKTLDIFLATGAEEAPEEEIVPEIPVESETEEVEEDNVVVDDANPETGVALALVPAAIALAVVALKRR